MSPTQRLRWLEDLGLSALVAALIATWVNLWLRWILRLAAPANSAPDYFPAVMALVVLAGAGVTRWAAGAHWSMQKARGIVGVTGCLTVITAVWLGSGMHFVDFASDVVSGQRRTGDLAPWALAAVITSTYLWWRGIHVGRSRISHHALSSSFSGGIHALAVLLFANSVQPLIAAGDVVAPVLLFFALGLGGLAVTSLRRERLQQREVTVARFGLNRYWLATATAVIGVVLLGGLFTAQVVAPESLRSVTDAVQSLLDLLSLGLLVVLIPVLVLAERLLEPLYPVLAHLVGSALALIQQLIAVARGLSGLLLRLMAAPFPRLFSPENLEQFLNSPAVRASGLLFAVLAIMLGLGLIFGPAVRRFRSARMIDVDETRESILSRQLLWAQLKSLFSHRNGRPPAAASLYLALVGPPDDARLIVRRAYQTMLDWAYALSLPRAAGQTPRAYAEVLAGALPQGQEAIATLTNAYVHARYAAEAPSLEEARNAQGALAQLLIVTRETGK